MRQSGSAGSARHGIGYGSGDSAVQQPQQSENDRLNSNTSTSSWQRQEQQQQFQQDTTTIPDEVVVEPPSYFDQVNSPPLPPRTKGTSSQSVSPLPTPSIASPTKEHVDETKSHIGRRFVGNTLAGRVVRASYKSLTTTVGLPLYLSPWGDNNPVTLPNIRRRDAALAFVGHLGAEALAPAALEVTGEALKFGAQQSAEQVADESLSKMFGGKVGKITQTDDGVRTLEVRIKHKLMGVDAVIQFQGERTAASMLSYSKGWFCPYLFASGRTPQIPRSKDFTVAELITPGLKADPELARTLLTAIEQDTSANILSLCDWNPTNDIGSTRLLVMFLGINPWRTNAWSQARIPGEARLMLHLAVGCPALVLPVTSSNAPVCSWSPWTLEQMQKAQKQKSSISFFATASSASPSPEDYSIDRHVQELSQYLETMVNTDALGSESTRQSYQTLIQVGLKNMIQSLVGGVEQQPDSSTGRFENSVLDAERAGIVLFRY